MTAAATTMGRQRGTGSERRAAHPSQLTRLQVFAYGGPAYMLFLLWVPVTVYLPQLYAKHTPLAFGVIGTIIVVSKVFDAVADQFIGLLSDRTRGRLGKRKPWLIAGTAVMLPSLWFLFHPPTDAGALYLILALNGFYLGWAMALIPYSAMAPELSANADDRARMAGSYGMGTALGHLTFNLLPICLFAIGMISSTEFSIELFGFTFWFFLLIWPPLLVLSLVALPNGSVHEHKTPSFAGLARSFSKNQPFLLYSAAFFLFTAATGVQAAVAFTFYDSYLHIGPYLPFLILIVVVATTMSVPFWTAISKRIGMHRSLALGWIVVVLVLQGYWFLSPGPLAPFILGALMLVLGLSQGINPITQSAMIANLVDYGQWKTGESNAGGYYAAQTFLLKVAQAAGSGSGFLLLGLIDFDVKPGATNSAFAVNGLFATLIVVPSILIVLGLILISRFPLDARRLAIVQRRLAARRGSEPTASPGAPALETP